jgi:hypothetical protein
MYQETLHFIPGMTPSANTPKGQFIIRLSDNAHIPMDENNKDYKEYLNWLSVGNKPKPAK